MSLSSQEREAAMARALGDAVVTLCTAELEHLDVDAVLRHTAATIDAGPLVLPARDGGTGEAIAELIRDTVDGVASGDFGQVHASSTGSFIATIAGTGARSLIVGFLSPAEGRGWNPILAPGLRALGAAYAVGRERRRLAAEIRSRDSVTQAVLEASLDSVVIIDSQDMVVEFNPAAERMFGYSRDEAVGQSMAELIVPPDYRERHERGIAHYLATGEGPVLGQHLQLPAMRADGSTFPAEIAIVPVVISGQPHFSGYVRDITVAAAQEQERERLLSAELKARAEAEGNREQLENQYQRLASLISSMGEAILVEDESRHIVVVNQAFCTMFHVPASPSTLVGADCSTAADQARPLMTEPDQFVARIAAILDARVPVANEEVNFVDGSCAERDFVPVFVAGNYRGHLWIYRDISARKESERQREEILAATRKQNDKLAELDQMKDDFIASVSHELRTPLTSVMSSASLLENPQLGKLSEKQGRFLDIISRNAERMLNVIGDLLLLAQLESSARSLELERTSVPDVVQSSAESIRILALDKQIDLQVHLAEGPLVEIDAFRMGQVVDNLLSNAIKFTPPGGSVTVTTDQQDGAWQITVTDTGIGIPDDEVDRIFARFYRASNADAVPEAGTGLGLSICKAIVDLHHGQLSFSSSPDGTWFRVRLPATTGP